MKALSIVVAIAGLLAGPAYFIHGLWFSGKHVGSYHSGQALELELDPAMNPIAIDVSVSSSSNTRQYFHLLLDQDGKRIAASSLSVSGDSNSSSGTLDVQVPRPGVYRFTVVNSTSPGSPISGLSVSVRRNTRAADLRIVFAGCLLLVIGLWMVSDAYRELD